MYTMSVEDFELLLDEFTVGEINAMSPEEQELTVNDLRSELSDGPAMDFDFEEELDVWERTMYA